MNNQNTVKGSLILFLAAIFILTSTISQVLGQTESQSNQIDLDNLAPITRGSANQLVKLLEFSGADMKLGRIFWAPDGEYFVAANWNGADVYKMPDLEAPFKSLPVFKENTWAMAMSPSDSKLAGSHNDLIIVDIVSGKEIERIKEVDPNEIESIAFNPDGTILAAGDRAERILLYDFKTKAMSYISHPISYLMDIEFNPQNGILVAVGGDPLIYRWDISAGIEMSPIEPHTFKQYFAIRDVAFSADGKLLAAANEDVTVSIIDFESGTELHVLEGVGDLITEIEFHPEEPLLAVTGGYTSTVQLWDTENGTLLATLDHEDEDSFTGSVAFSPDGKILVTLADTMIFWGIYE